MAANNTGDDITFGQTNAGQDGTELRADANDEGGFGNDFVLQLRVSPVIIHRNAVDGLRCVAVKQGRGVFAQAEEIAGVFGSCLGSGKDDIGVRGENEWDDTAPGHHLGDGHGVGVLGTVRLQNGVGVRGENVASAQPGIAIVGESSVGTGVQGISHGFSGKGVEGFANDGAEGVGVHGQANAALGVGVWAESDKGIAVNAVSSGTGTAVQGQSTSGVGGVFAAGPAVIQPSDAPPGRAGVFRADGAAQVRFVPHLAPNNPTSNQPFPAQALIAKGQEAAFPANGKPGDLLCAMMLIREPQGTVEVATLWFCETGGVDKTHPAHWRQVLLGPVLYGHG